MTAKSHLRKLAAAWSALSMSGVLHAQALPAIEPVSPWRVDYADSECRLIRVFGSGNSAVTLRIARGGTSSAFDSVIAGPGIPRLREHIAVTLALDPQGAAQELSGYSLGVPKTTDRFIRWFDADAELLRQFTSNQIIRISAGERYSVRLHLTQARAALAALDTCYVDLLKGWGIDPSLVVGVAVPPKPEGAGSLTVAALRAGARPPGPAGWVTWQDYPTEALRQEIGGTVVTALAINLAGRVDSCRVIVSSKSTILDDRTCAVLSQRARYSPGLNKDGKPMLATTLLRVRWSIPED